MINKFLYPKRGAETYMLKLAEGLIKEGHEVQFFGMDDEKRIVGNNVNLYTSNMDFHTKNIFKKINYLFKSIYSFEARKKIRIVLDDFNPDVCHLNNFNYQLTPSIILEIEKWRKETNKKCKIVYTAHDCQLVCPNHMLYIPSKKCVCTKCIDGNYGNCIINKCVHNNFFKSIVGTIESYYWHDINKVYKYIDTIICPSKFTKDVLDHNEQLKTKTVVLHNFVEKVDISEVKEENIDLYDKYVLYFGSYTEEKGVKDLINICKELKDINFIFVGDGPLKDEIDKLDNAKNLGYCTGNKLNYIIKNAYVTINPTKVYETYGLTNVESINLGTPVISSKIGGIVEIIDNGVNGYLVDINVNEFKDKIEYYWKNTEELEIIKSNIRKKEYYFVEDYISKVLIYYGKRRIY